jgi:hypothetical protein
MAQAALDMMIERATDPAKKPFGKQLYEHGKSNTHVANPNN